MMNTCLEGMHTEARWKTGCLAENGAGEVVRSGLVDYDMNAWPTSGKPGEPGLRRRRARKSPSSARALCNRWPIVQAPPRAAQRAARRHRCASAAQGRGHRPGYGLGVRRGRVHWGDEVATAEALIGPRWACTLAAEARWWLVACGVGAVSSIQFGRQPRVGNWVLRQFGQSASRRGIVEGVERGLLGLVRPTRCGRGSNLGNGPLEQSWRMIPMALLDDRDSSSSIPAPPRRCSMARRAPRLGCDVLALGSTRAYALALLGPFIQTSSRALACGDAGRAAVRRRACAS